MGGGARSQAAGWGGEGRGRGGVRPPGLPEESGGGGGRWTAARAAVGRRPGKRRKNSPFSELCFGSLGILHAVLALKWFIGPFLLAVLSTTPVWCGSLGIQLDQLAAEGFCCCGPLET
jgi:hypothetical protein